MDDESTIRESGGPGKTPAALRALEIVRLVSKAPGDYSFARVAAELGVAKSTVHRVVDYLCDAGYLSRGIDGKGVTPGWKLRTLAFDVLQNDFLSSGVKSVLSEVAQQVGETCNITTLSGLDIVYLERVETRWPLRFTLQLGSRIPVHCCASGKAFLAFMEESERKRIIRRLTLKRVTGRTIVSKEAFINELAATRKSGYGLDDQEFIEGMCGIAVPIFDSHGCVRATISIHAPAVRCGHAEALSKWVPLLEASGRRIHRIAAA